MKLHINNTQRNRYMAQKGSSCPFCERQAIDRISNVNLDSGLAWVALVCLHCRREWEEHYKMVDVVARDTALGEVRNEPEA